MGKGQETVTIKVDEAVFSKMVSFYSERKDPTNEYQALFAKEGDVTVTAYKADRHGLHSVVFQGYGALNEARIWDENAKLSKAKSSSGKAPMKTSAAYPQIGSDEVGTGDFFGPVIVVAAYVEERDLPYLKKLGVTDSKAMEDSYILEIGPALIKKFDYSQLALDDSKFNEVAKDNNMNEIKAKMHNRALLNVLGRHPGARLYQDQFAAPSSYYRYLRGECEIAKGIIFSVKGETAFPSVALASVIARYSFLRKMDELGKRHGVKFPHGAGKNVERFARAFYAERGEEELREVAKLTFKTYKRIASGK